MATKAARQDDREKKYSGWIKEGYKHREEFAQKWPQWLGYLSNKPSTESASDHEYHAFINLVWNNIQNLRPSLYFKNPNFKADVRPGADGTVPTNAMYATALAENVLHYYMKETRQKQEFKIALVEALMLNVSFHKQGYHVPTQKIEKKRKLLAKIRDGLGDLQTDLADSVKDMEEQDATALMLDDVPDNETWWGKWVSAWDVLLPYGYGSKIDDHPWLVHRILIRRDDAQRKYDKIREREIEPTYKYSVQGDGPSDCYELFEVWDWHARKVVYLVPDSGTEIIIKEIDWPAGLEKFPFRVLKFYDVPGQFYSHPDPEFVHQIQDSINEIINTALGYLRRAKAMYTSNQELTPQQKKDLETPVDGKVIEKLTGLNLIPNPPVPQDSYGMVNRMIGFFDQLAGMTEYQRGGTIKDRTATEANYLQTGLQIRLDEKRDILEDWLAEVGQMAFKLIQKNMSAPLMVKLSPQEMSMFKMQNPWARVSQEELNADMSIWVVSGSTQKDDSVAEAQRVDKWFNQSANLPFVDLKYIWRLWSVKTVGLPEEEVDRAILPEVDPDAEGLAKAENMMALSGMELSPPDPGESHQIHIQIHQGFLQSINPEAIRRQLAALEQQAQMYMRAGQVLPDDLNRQIQELRDRFQKAPMAAQKVQAQLQAHEQLMANQSMKPLDYNTSVEKLRGAATPAELAGGPQG